MNTLSKEYTNFLDALRFSLFSENAADFNSFNIPNILSEAEKQAVLPLVYSALEGQCDLSQYTAQYYSVISSNVRVFEEHKSLHKLLTENGVKYVFLKGCASARYYPDPLLRTMGDVDLLILPEDTQKVDQLLTDNGYTKTADSQSLGTHISYKSPTGVKCELHRQINGIPKSDKGQKIDRLFADIFDKADEQNGEYFCPCDFHHGLILLLHTATHLINEGVGLRHLCDWAVFIEKFKNEEFIALFQKPLSEAGLWRFAQVLAACSVKYLGCTPKTWMNERDDKISDALIKDILSGGNFGIKDTTRYQQIKYIANRSNKTVADSHPAKQVFSNLVIKARRYKTIKKYPLLLPFGCIFAFCHYIYLVLTKKRRPDNKQILTDAAARKKLYNKFELYK